MFDVGDLVEVTAAFTNLEGVATNPTAVVLRVVKPDGTASTVTASNTGTVGEYAGSVTVDQAGLWEYRFTGSGAVVAAEEGRFLVRTQRVPAA